MKLLRPALFLALAAVSTSCKSAPGPTTTPPTTTEPLDVAIASVTLADDCGTGPTTTPPAPIQAAASMEQAGDVPAGARMMSQAKRACEQSSIQLRVANGTTAASAIAIEKIELLDDGGNLIGELTPRAPSRWADDSYQAWDGQVGPSEILQVSYALSAPNVMRGATYTVRVTVAAGGSARKLEQRTHLEAEASLPPGVVT